MKLVDWLIIILLIGLLVFAMLFYFNRTHDQCINNPFVYGARELKEATGYEVYGFAYFETPFYSETKIYFNTTNSYKK